MKKRAKFRVGMHTEDPEELSYLFSGYQVLDMADAPVPGSGFYTYGAGGPRPFKARRLEPDAITRGCIACADRRPALDPISLDVSLAPQYRGRWARTLPQLYPDTERFADQVENYLARLAEDAFAELADEARVAIDINGDEGADDDQVTAAMKNALGPASEMTGPVTIDQLDAMFAAAGTTGPPTTATEPDRQHDGGETGDFDRVMAETGETPPAAPVELIKPKVKPRTLTPELRAYTLLYEAGPDGTGAKQLSITLEAQEVNAPRTTVQGWLKNWADAGKAVRTGSGSHTRYVHTEHATEENP
jgi:S-DNA-T family DNA segregation ATPase FtsK/SpoIIIE